MGAVYSIRAYLLYDDEQAVVEAVQKFIRDHSHEVDFTKAWVRELDANKTLMNALQVLFTNYVYKTDPAIRTKYYGYDTDNCYESDFNASYGWETVMTDAFEYMAPALKDGSELYIWPDFGEDYLVIQNGACIWVH